MGRYTDCEHLDTAGAVARRSIAGTAAEAVAMTGTVGSVMGSVIAPQSHQFARRRRGERYDAG